MRAHPLAPWLRVVFAALVLALGSGAGLPGIVHALAPAAHHVCTCASGGSHAACPVCNPALNESRSHRPSVNGVPCGAGHTAMGTTCDLGVISPRCPMVDAPFARAHAVRDVMRQPGGTLLERPTPPPRFARA